jgi:hypothetical protein
MLELRKEWSGDVPATPSISWPVAAMDMVLRNNSTHSTLGVLTMIMIAKT